MRRTRRLLRNRQRQRSKLQSRKRIKHSKQRGGAPSKAMVIVEPRAHPLLAPVIKNFHVSMPPNWDLYVFHGKSHADYAKEATKDIQGRTVHLKALDTDNLTGGDNGSYNQLFLTQAFWDQIDAEDILIFQTDSVLCGKGSIEDYTKYSYIGCAYNNQQIGKWSPWNGATFYGVGGLSFRKKSFTKRCIDTPGRPTHAEDVAFSWCAENVPGAVKPESAQTIANFCAQSSLHADPPLGVHKTNFEMHGADKERLLKVCPAAKIIG
jgi:hypothetical protein